jgi:hypothetical protein
VKVCRHSDPVWQDWRIRQGLVCLNSDLVEMAARIDRKNYDQLWFSHKPKDDPAPEFSTSEGGGYFGNDNTSAPNADDDPELFSGELGGFAAYT